MFKLFKNFKTKQWLLLLVVVALTVAQVLLSLKLPDYMGDIVELIQKSPYDAAITTADIVNVALKMGGVILGILASAIVIGYLASIISSDLGLILRKKLYKKVNEFSMEEINKFSTSSLITRSSNDITQIQQVFTMLIRLALTAPLMGILAIVKIIGKSSTLSLVTGGSIVVLLLVIMVIGILVMPKFKTIQKLTDRLNGVTRENLTGLRVVRAFGAEKYETEKFEETNKDITKITLYVNRVANLLNPAMSLIMSLLGLLIIWIGAGIVNVDPLFLKELSTFTQYAMQVLFSFAMLTMLFVMLPRAMVSAKRINEVLETKTKIIDGAIAEIPEDTKGEIEFKNVSFMYPDADGYILKNISFKTKAGQTVAFIGSTGSGKSTLINLIPRFYDATDGEILVNGVNVKDYKIETLNSLIGYVPQKGILFGGSITENMLVGNQNATTEEINAAIDIAQASDFVGKFENKLEHHISQGGKNVSGGQKQRLSIARAIVKNPQIYIFDDSFSALDYKTDKALRGALKEKTNGATNLIVAQRIGTIMEADNIIVLDNGEIVGQGTHKQLLKNCKVYKEIAYSQLSKEELK